MKMLRLHETVGGILLGTSLLESGLKSLTCVANIHSVIHERLNSSNKKGSCIFHQ